MIENEVEFLNEIQGRLGSSLKFPKGLFLERNKSGALFMRTDKEPYLGSLSKEGKSWKFFWLSPLISFKVADSKSVLFLNKFPR